MRFGVSCFTFLSLGSAWSLMSLPEKKGISGLATKCFVPSASLFYLFARLWWQKGGAFRGCITPQKKNRVLINRAGICCFRSPQIYNSPWITKGNIFDGGTSGTLYIFAAYLIYDYFKWRSHLGEVCIQEEKEDHLWLLCIQIIALINTVWISSQISLGDIDNIPWYLDETDNFNLTISWAQ